MRSRVLGVVVGLALATTACGAVTTGSSGGAPHAAGRSPTAGSTPQTVPPDCSSGVAKTVDDALRIITDGPDCPGSTNRFWRHQLGDTWTTPTILSYDDGDVPDSKCAEGGDPEEFTQNAFYCQLDDKILYSNQLLDRVFAEGGPYLPVVTLEHELVHRADFLGHTLGVVTRSEENQADCGAGATTRFAREAGRLPRTDVLRSALLFFQLGDTSHFGDETANDPSAHGSPGQRVTAFSRGYFQGLGVCDDIGRDPNGHAA